MICEKEILEKREKERKKGEKEEHREGALNFK